MPALNVDLIFDAAIRIHLTIDRSLTVNFSENGIKIKFPTTRALAEFLKVPHYYVLPYFAMMEEDELVKRAERIGIFTTPKGTRKYLDTLWREYRNQGLSILGPEICRDIFEMGSK
ncbi:MAG TPA: hypothetical protein VMW63_03355 [Methanoregulaceae archaeon]|nr:hypothetical protein [Methanoregulaceae archaeon]